MFTAAGGIAPAFAAHEYIAGDAVVSGQDDQTQASPWTVDGTLYVGSDQGSTLRIIDGGIVNSTSGAIGSISVTDPGIGMASVSGAGSQWNNTKGIGVGSSGSTGTLQIDSGGVVTTRSAVNIGSGEGSMGYATISGVGSVLDMGTGSNSSSSLHVGTYTGTGQLTVEAGGRVATTFETFVGNGTYSDGTITVTGADSSWENNKAIYLGIYTGSVGALRILDGGSVINHGFGVAAYGEDTQGTILVSGSGSRLSNATYLSIGGSGAGKLTIDDGGAVDNAMGYVGENVGADGSVSVTHAGTWTNAGLAIGNRGAGTLTVDAQGKVTADNTQVAVYAGTTGTINIGAAVGSAATAAGSLETPTLVFGAGNGLLNFNHTDTHHSFGAAIRGTGAIVQNGPGTTALTGDSSGFTGSTTVNAGTLRVDGVLGTASASVTVNDGATLSGNGTLGSPVTVATGATLAGTQGQTLTTGALTLANGSHLDVALGAPATDGLFQVNGDLTLAGAQLDISDLGGFGTGVYRLIDYTGTLAASGIGLGIGTRPHGVGSHDLAVQTAVDKQVNLISIAGTPLDFWDGPGNSANDSIEGGNGIWDADNANWTNTQGQLNSNWRDSAFAVFQGQAGTVTVDSHLGDVAVGGMQLAVDGYRIEGDSITLADAETIVRVGDGTLSGADMTATIASGLTGDGGLVKTDYGTLVLSGDNTYRGGTTIRDGVLQIASNSNLGDAAGALALGGNALNEGTLATTADIDSARAITLLGRGNFDTAAGTTLTLNGVIAGAGSLLKQGDGMLSLTAGNTYAGDTKVDAGTLVGNADSIRGNLENQAITLFAQDNDGVFAGDVSGSGLVHKQGNGELTLSGTSSSHWRIDDGVLRTAAERFSGDATVAVDGTLVFEQNADTAYAGALSGEGALRKTGSATLLLSGDNTLSGTTTVAAGILQAGVEDAFSAASTHVVNSGAVLALDGHDQTLASLVNAGTVTFAAPANTFGGTTMTVKGDHVGNGGTLLMNTALGGDDSLTDKLIVEGDTRGNSFVQVKNAGGVGALTDNGIELIHVDGASDGVFELQGRAVAGLYDYQLYKGGKNTPDGGGWYLRSELPPINPPTPPVDPEIVDPPTLALRPEPAAYLGNQNAALRMFQHTMHDRVGEPGLTARDDDGQNYAAWVRVQNRNLDAGTVGGQIDIDTNATTMQMGAEKQFAVGEGRIHAGVMGGYGRATTDGVSNFTDHKARGEVKGTNLGVYGTWFQNAEGPEGLYVDGWMQYGRFDNTVKGDYLGREQYDSQVWSGSLEAGYALSLHRDEHSGLYIEPQAQVIYTDFSSDDVTEDNGTLVQTRKAGGTTTRLGARLYSRPTSTQHNRVQPFVAVNWWSGGNESTISMDGERLSRDLPKNTYEAKVGAQLELGSGWSGWGQLGYQQGSNGYRDVNGQVGVKLSW